MANLTAVVMPKWGMEMTEGELAEWHVALGDEVAANTDIVDVETAKIVNTVINNDAGIVVRLCAAIGDVVPVGGLLLVLADGAVSEDDIDTFVAANSGEVEVPVTELAPAAPPPEDVTTAGAPATDSGPHPAGSLADGPDDGTVPVSVVARRVAHHNGINLTHVAATGRHGRVSLDDVRRAAASAGLTLAMPEARVFAASPLISDVDLKATPVARRMAAALEVNLQDCRATGRHGRISKADVEVAAARRGKLSASVSVGDSCGVEATAQDSVIRQPLSGARRAIARVVSKAKQEVPHFRVNIDVDLTAAMALRKALNARQNGVNISLNDVLIKACAIALRDNPRVNGRFDGETLEHHSQANIASAVATDNGVFMPVLQHAGGLTLDAISTAMRDLAARAKTGRLSSDEMTLATFSISNLGMFGIDSFDAIINQPALTILAVGAAVERPVVRNGELAVAPVMTMSLSSDHRVVDGADAARFMANLRVLLEESVALSE